MNIVVGLPLLQGTTRTRLASTTEPLGPYSIGKLEIR
jgi:hypothetical protein